MLDPDNAPLFLRRQRESSSTTSAAGAAANHGNSNGSSSELLFADVARAVRGTGRSSIVSRATFVERFSTAFTRGALTGMNWENMIVAGGAVMACAQSYDKAEEGGTGTGLGWGWEDGTGTGLGDTLPAFNRTLERLYKESDLDIFLYGLDAPAANAKLREIYAALKGHCGNHELLVVRTNNAVTFACDYPIRHVQVILRLYSSPAEILMGFDVDSCAVCFDGTRALAMPRAVRALTRGVNVIDVGRRSYTSETRLLKCAQRGFAVQSPGLRREDIDPGNNSAS
jgi:hypothetical protein